MKRLLILIALFLPLTVTGAVSNWRMAWDPLPQEQTIHGECQINGEEWTEVGTAPGNGSIRFQLDGPSGSRKPCRAYTTLAGLPDSPRSEVVVVILPLDTPSNLRVAQEP